jgi:NAD(P)-dependent dehydrogenase (short-subunit alcohol dehydrogenase family)
LSPKRAAHGVRANVIWPGFVRTPLVDKQIPEQAKDLGISEQDVIKNVILKNPWTASRIQLERSDRAIALFQPRLVRGVIWKA